jgi:hypothetical protein
MSSTLKEMGTNHDMKPFWLLNINLTLLNVKQNGEPVQLDVSQSPIV